MNGKKYFISLKTKIMISTLIPLVISFILVCVIFLTSFFHARYESAKSGFQQISQKHAHNFEGKINDAMNYLSILASELAVQAETGVTNREELQKIIWKVFDGYKLIDGSSVYFESNQYDGKDADYIGSEYGTAKSGRICWYFYIDDGETAYLPEGMANDIEFELPHYTKAKEENKPVYTDPATHEVDGKQIPMFTLTYPIKDEDGKFIGAVTVDLFLNDIYMQLQNEAIYETGYMIIANDNGQIVYSPRYEDIGKRREESGLTYLLPAGEHSTDFFSAKSIINGKDALVTLHSIYIPQLDSSFFISVTVPLDEINAEGVRLTALLILFGLFIIAATALLIFYLVGRVSAPLHEITESVDRIAGGEYNARIEGNYKNEFAVLKNSVNTMATSIEAYIAEAKGSLDILKNILNGLDAVIYVSDPETDEILFVNDSMKALFHLENDVTGQICWKVFQLDFEKRCDFCPCYQLDKDPSTPVVWEEHNTVTKRYYSNTDSYIDWHGGRKAHLQHSVDVTDVKMAQFALDRRLEQQALMTSISQSFLSGAGIDTLLANALRMVGEFMGVSQILFYQREGDNASFLCQSEWLGPGVESDSRIGDRIVATESTAFVLRNMANKNAAYLSSDDPAMKEAMAPYRKNFQSFITTPVFVKDKICAMLDFSKKDDGENWSGSDINLAVLVSSLLSGVFERHFMEGQLRRLSSIVESSPQFILYVTAEGKIDYVNPAAETITGYTEAELITGGLEIILDAQVVRDIKEKHIPNTLQNGTDNFEINLTCKSGRERIMAFSSFTTGTDSTNVGCIASDVTEIRALEDELIAAKELAEQGNRSKSEFLSRMSHEMRTPMNAIIGMTNIAKDSGDPAKKEYCLDKIDNASRHLLGVINDILDMSKIEANKFELSHSEFHFEQMITSVLNVIHFRMDEKQQSFSLFIDPVIPVAIISDEQHLGQVITNLLSNAVKFTPEQGTIHLKAHFLGEESGALTIRIEVADNGIGMSEEQQSRLFHSFEQADGSIARKFGGTGLGLAISKRIVELMGGEIWTESELGKGSRFLFTLKAKRGEGAITGLPEQQVEIAAEQRPEEEKADSQTPLEGKTVLLAEDVDINREIVTTVLEDTKIVIDCAENGKQAVDMFAAAPGKYDLIFMDMHMPEVDGLEATRRIRALDVPEGTTVPIVAMTANVFQEDINKCLEAGMNDHIGKPIDFGELFDKLMKYLG